MQHELFSENLKAIMDHNGLKVKTLARKAGLARTTLIMALKPGRQPSLGTVTKLLNVMPGITFEDLVTPLGAKQ